MFNSSESKSVDPAIWSDPFGWEFSGVELSISWCNVFGTCGSGKKARRRARRAAFAAAVERNIAENNRIIAQRRLEEQQRQASAQSAREAQARAAAQRAQEEAQEQARIEAAKALVQRKKTTAQITTERIQKQQQESIAALRQQQLELAEAEVETGSLAGQPGISRTPVTAGGALGGYSGTAPGAVSPTSLNI